MKNSDKEFEKQQTVSIGRGLSILGFFGDELATAEEMEQFLKPQKKVLPKPVVKPKANIQKLADEWIVILDKTTKLSTSVSRFELNLNPLRQEYLTELQQINTDLIQQQRIDQHYISQQKQITNRKK